MAKKKKKNITLEEEAQRKQTILGGVLFSLAVVIVALVYYVLDEEPGQVCPACNQHYIVIDNSEALDEKALTLLRAPSRTLGADGKCTGKIRYDQGLVGVIWNQSKIGDQINLYGLSDKTLEAELLTSTIRVKNPDIEEVDLDENASLLSRAQDKAYCDINLQLATFSRQSDLAKSKIFETMHDIALKIRNHQEAYGGSITYTVTLYSDLLQNSDSYSFYGSPAVFSDWITTQQSTIGLPAFPTRVKVNIEKLPRATSPVSEDFLLDFWSDYLEQSAANYTIRKG